jgi:hypothetical protein
MFLTTNSMYDAYEQYLMGDHNYDEALKILTAMI